MPDLSEIESFTNPLSRHILIFSGKAELFLWIFWQLSVRLKFIPSTWWENHRQEPSFTWVLTQPLLQNSVNSTCMSTPILCLVTWLPQEGIIESVYVGTKRIKDHLWFTKRSSPNTLEELAMHLFLWSQPYVKRGGSGAALAPVHRPDICSWESWVRKWLI